MNHQVACLTLRKSKRPTGHFLYSVALGPEGNLTNSGTSLLTQEKEEGKKVNSEQSFQLNIFEERLFEELKDFADQDFSDIAFL